MGRWQTSPSIALDVPANGADRIVTSITPVKGNMKTGLREISELDGHEPMCGYRKFHILGAEVVSAGKIVRVVLTQESNAGWPTDGRCNQRGNGRGWISSTIGRECFQLAHFQAARRS